MNVPFRRDLKHECLFQSPGRCHSFIRLLSPFNFHFSAASRHLQSNFSTDVSLPPLINYLNCSCPSSVRCVSVVIISFTPPAVTFSLWSVRTNFARFVCLSSVLTVFKHSLSVLPRLTVICVTYKYCAVSPRQHFKRIFQIFV